MVRAESARKQAELQLATRAPTVHAYLKELGSRGPGKVTAVVSSIRSLELPSFPQLRVTGSRLVQSAAEQAQGVKAQVLETKTAAVARAACAAQQATQIVKDFASMQQAQNLVASLTKTTTQRAQGARARAVAMKATVITKGTEAAQVAEKTLREQLAARLGEKKAAQVMDWLVIPATLC
mmetsp:Transcript_81718/g.218738  ORF Transcript_81718/g.218738 Transcript_81718/m.218738 type:complete len:180 (+) Transcript_81718:1230-1769(+)